MSSTKKPHPLAIPTIYGWALPATGEILVSKKGLPNPVPNFKPGRPYVMPEITEVAVKEEKVVNSNEPQTPEELNKILGSDVAFSGVGRPAGSNDVKRRALRGSPHPKPAPVAKTPEETDPA